MISPTFTSGKMKKMYPLIDDCLKFLMDNLESHAVSGKEAVVKDVFGCLTMDVIAKCAFGTDTNANKDKNNPFVINGKKVFEINLLKALFVNLVPNFILKMLGIKLSLGGNEEANEFFFNVARHVIKKRRENNERREDFLQLLIDCQDASKINEEKNKENQEKENQENDNDT